MQKSDGTTLPTTRYTPFGNLRSGTGFAPFTNRDFTGQRENRELGLLYYQARYYLPGIGRFASADTIVPDPQNPQHFNRYTYSLNSPLNFSDPTGHDPVWCNDPYDAGNNPVCHGSSGTPTPTPTGTPTSTPTPASTPSPTPNPIIQQLLGSTVQIGFGGTISQAFVLNNHTLLTHNHFTGPIGSAMTIYDAAGNVICTCNLARGLVHFQNVRNGDFMDLTEISFVGEPFTGLSTLPSQVIANSSLIGQEIYLTNLMDDENTSSHYRTEVVQTTIANTAYITDQDSRVPQHLGDISGLQVNYALDRGASGGPAAIIFNGQLVVIGINSSRTDFGKSYLASPYQ